MTGVSGPRASASGRLRRAALPVVAALLALAGGCKSSELPDLDAGTPITRGAAPDYGTVAADHNRRATVAGMMSADAVGTLQWMENGEQRTEQVEAKLYYGGPGKVHLAVRKLSQTLLILGSKPDGLYFAVDVRAKPPAMRVGGMRQWPQAGAGGSARAGTLASLTGVARALDDVLGVAPVPLEAGTLAGTQWSSRGHLLGLSYERADRGGVKVRRWLSTDGQLKLLQTELFAPTGGPLATSRVQAFDVLTGGTQSPPPLLPAAILIAVEGAEQVRIDLRLVDVRQEATLNPVLFDAAAQAEAAGVTRLIDLDGTKVPEWPTTTPTAGPAAAQPAAVRPAETKK